MATAKISVKLTAVKLADLVEQVLEGQTQTYEQRCEYKQGYLDGVSTVVRFLRSLERDAE